eukprot:COSAG01_NODE_4046_length_5403_cov_7.683446_1_plen_428_part_10
MQTEVIHRVTASRGGRVMGGGESLLFVLSSHQPRVEVFEIVEKKEEGERTGERVRLRAVWCLRGDAAPPVWIAPAPMPTRGGEGGAGMMPMEEEDKVSSGEADDDEHELEERRRFAVLDTKGQVFLLSLGRDDRSVPTAHIGSVPGLLREPAAMALPFAEGGGAAVTAGDTAAPDIFDDEIDLGRSTKRAKLTTAGVKHGVAADPDKVGGGALLLAGAPSVVAAWSAAGMICSSEASPRGAAHARCCLLMLGPMREVKPGSMQTADDGGHAHGEQSRLVQAEQQQEEEAAAMWPTLVRLPAPLLSAVCGLGLTLGLTQQQQQTAQPLQKQRGSHRHDDDDGATSSVVTMPSPSPVIALHGGVDGVVRAVAVRHTHTNNGQQQPVEQQVKVMELGEPVVLVAAVGAAAAAAAARWRRSNDGGGGGGGGG